MDEYIGIIKLFAGIYAPQGWYFCDGSILNTQQFPALFALIGNQYGGDGKTTYALPDLRGSVPIGAFLSGGNNNYLTRYSLGQEGGNERISLNTSQLPLHVHPISDGHGGITASVTVNAGGDGTTNNPQGSYWGAPAGIANNTVKSYTPNKEVTMASDAVTLKINGSTGYVGNNQPIDVRQPYLALNYIICINGIYPQRQ